MKLSSKWVDSEQCIRNNLQPLKRLPHKPIIEKPTDSRIEINVEKEDESGGKGGASEKRDLLGPQQKPLFSPLLNAAHPPWIARLWSPSWVPEKVESALQRVLTAHIRSEMGEELRDQDFLQSWTISQESVRVFDPTSLSIKIFIVGSNPESGPCRSPSVEEVINEYNADLACRNKRRKTCQDTPGPSTEDPEIAIGFPDWHADPRYVHIFHDLQEVQIPSRPPHLPRLYRHVSANERAKKFEEVDEVPQGPLSEMDNHDLFRVTCGDWIMACDLHGIGSAIDDIVKVFIPMKYIVLLGTISAETIAGVQAARAMALGAEETRDVICLPIELNDEGTRKITPVKPENHCYSLDITSECQTKLSVPNCNARIRDGKAGNATQMRFKVLNAAVKMFDEGFQEAPLKM
ncbi:hypothetical protein K474DRAFT_1673590 [Panus rudis PR-1116 ss-1]|nr:hypothetical protein K474DRAFT_1673590 [Panus rudis PR-1116 ss-1]